VAHFAPAFQRLFTVFAAFATPFARDDSAACPPRIDAHAAFIELEQARVYAIQHRMVVSINDDFDLGVDPLNVRPPCLLHALFQEAF
jgi:hypothetical protein